MIEMPPREKLKKILRQPKKAALTAFSEVYNTLLAGIARKPSYPAGQLPALNFINEHARRKTDISNHLKTLFSESMSVNPRLIVELGVRTGESTLVFERIAEISHAKLISVDTDDCEKISHSSHSKNRIFVRKDDIPFGQEFGAWCVKNNITPEIDILFIDTSHLYEHTKQEIDTWFPYLAKTAKVFFHDTNLKTIYFREDGSMGIGWDNKRGVIRALEDYFNKKLDEKQSFVDFDKGWLIKHRPYSSGLTILERNKDWKIS